LVFAVAKSMRQKVFLPGQQKKNGKNRGKKLQKLAISLVH